MSSCFGILSLFRWSISRALICGSHVLQTTVLTRALVIFVWGTAKARKNVDVEQGVIGFVT